MFAKDSIPLYLFWQIIKAVEEVLTSLPEMLTMYGQGVSSSKTILIEDKIIPQSQFILLLIYKK